MQHVGREVIEFLGLATTSLRMGIELVGWMKV